MAVEKIEEQAKFALEEAKDRAEFREREIRLGSFEAGCAAALLVYNSSIDQTITNYSLGKGQPGIPKVIIDVLSCKTGANDPLDYTLWVNPKFKDVAIYLADLDGTLKMLFGNYTGEDST
jgi:hypothetical protein